MERSEDQFDEYKLPGDEPLKHQWDTNVQFDWYRHLPTRTQNRLSPEGDHAKAWEKHTAEQEGHWIANSLRGLPADDTPIQKLPGKSLQGYYGFNKKKKKK